MIAKMIANLMTGNLSEKTAFFDASNKIRFHLVYPSGNLSLPASVIGIETWIWNARSCFCFCFLSWLGSVVCLGSVDVLLQSRNLILQSCCCVRVVLHVVSRASEMRNENEMVRVQHRMAFLI